MRWTRRLVAAAIAAAAAQAASGCGTDAIGTDACRKIEQERCRKAPGCPALQLTSDGVEECAQFARDRCLHGLAVADPGVPAVDSCVAAIDRATCDVVASPETAPECAFLRPVPLPEAGPDVAVDAPGTEAASQTESGAGQPD